ncbi:MAG: PAS domain-containing sensor histidine kinase [Leptospiraceae bacterium]|nr:PAS domain-containing sensor histidine kinase [Leptospiraceae bacterium]
MKHKSPVNFIYPIYTGEYELLYDKVEINTMIPETPNTTTNLTLRQRAVIEFNKKHSLEASFLNETEENKFIHEIEIHQIELAMQNEELIQANEKLEAATRKYTARYDFAPMGYYTLEKDGTISELNISGAELLSKAHSALLKANFKLFISEQTRQTFNSFFQRVTESGHKEICEVQLIEDGIPGKQVHIEGIYSFVEKNFLITAIDITEQKNAEERIKSYTDELEKVNQAKDKFFSIIADDLRNPFIGIITISELLEGKLSSVNNELSSQLLKYVEIIHASSKSAFTVLENLMQWSKSQTGDIGFNPTSRYMNRIIEATLPLITVSAFKKNITIENGLMGKDLVYADEALVTTILRNLLTNAIKYTFFGGKIILSTEVNGKFLEVSVADSGIGIETVNFDKIFRLDSKFTELGTENESGTGLGLILCKEFVEKQGGSIWVKSKLGIGTVVTFTLPLELEGQANEEQ